MASADRCYKYLSWYKSLNVKRAYQWIQSHYPKFGHRFDLLSLRMTEVEKKMDLILESLSKDRVQIVQQVSLCQFEPCTHDGLKAIQTEQVQDLEKFLSRCQETATSIQLRLEELTAKTKAPIKINRIHTMVQPEPIRFDYETRQRGIPNGRKSESVPVQRIPEQRIPDRYSWWGRSREET